MVLLAVGLVRDAERGDLNRGRKTVETRRVIGQQPGARTLVGRNMGQGLKECLIGMRLLDVNVRPVGVPHDPLRGGLQKGLRKGERGLQRALFCESVRAR